MVCPLLLWVDLQCSHPPKVAQCMEVHPLRVCLEATACPLLVWVDLQCSHPHKVAQCMEVPQQGFPRAADHLAVSIMCFMACVMSHPCGGDVCVMSHP